MHKPNFMCLLIICLCLIAICGGGCSGCGKSNVPLPALDSSEQSDSLTSALSIDIYVDASLSMQGFAAPGTWTDYARTLTLLESSAITGWPEGRVKFFKFGTQVKNLADDRLLKAVFPSFYSDPEILGTTRIDNVVDSARVGRLVVIVTDLFQSDADVNLLTRKLRDYCLAKNLAIGLLGIKSKFRGTVYDVGSEKRSFKYPCRSADAPRDRPFFVIMLGKHVDLAHYYESLKSKGLPGPEESNFLIMSQYLANPLPSFDKGKIDSMKTTIDEISPLFPGGTRNNRSKQFRVRGNNGSASFDASLEFHLLPYTVPFDPELLESEVVALRCERDTLLVDGAAEQYFRIVRAVLKNDHLSHKVELKPSGLRNGKPYWFVVTLRPKADAYSMPAWVSDWNMDTGNVDSWVDDPCSFDGSTTLNLKRFVTDLWQATVGVRHPLIAKLYYCVKKE